MARKTTGPASARTSDEARTTPLTHEERRRLIEQPFSTRRIPGKTWGGLYIRAELPTEGRRTYSPTPEDEEVYRVHFPDEYSGGLVEFGSFKGSIK